MKSIIVSEADHSIFYAPIYVSIENGYFKKEGLDINLKTEFGSDNATKSLLLGYSDIGIVGPESTLYLYNEKSNKNVLNFAKLTNRPGDFLVSRYFHDNFNWNDVKGKTILGSRNDGMPEIILEYILKNNCVNPETDVNINKSIPFNKTADIFSAGYGDYTVEFEPAATNLVSNYDFHIIKPLGLDSGYIPYTTLCALDSYTIKYPDIINSFKNAVQMGIDYVNNNLSKDIAKLISSQFPSINISVLSSIIDIYKKQNTWGRDLLLDKKSFILIENILISSNRLSSPIPYECVVYNR